MTYLSPHFSLAEMTASQTAARKGLKNDPPDWVLENLTNTAEQMEKVRALLGHPILVSSGYRSPAVNRAVGGSTTSAHTQGYAVDFICPRFGTPLEVCQAIAGSDIAFDQLIEECARWVHISFEHRLRGQVLTYAAGRYRVGLAA